MVWAATLPAQIVYQEDFSAAADGDPLTGSGFTVIDLSGDGLGGSSTHGLATWFVSSTGLGAGVPFWAGPGAGLLWDGNEPNDDWAISPGFALNAGTTYNIMFDVDMEGWSPAAVSLQARIGTGATVGDMLAGTQLFTQTTVAPFTTSAFVPFTPGTTGTYHLGFQDFSAADANYVMFGNIVVEEAANFASDLTPNTTTATVRRGFEAQFPYTITNTGSGSDDFTLAVSSGTWTTTLYESDGVTPLAANPVTVAGSGGAFSFVVGVDISGATAAGTADSYTVSATGVNSSDSSTLDITAVIYDEPFAGVASGADVADYGFTVFDLSGVSDDFPAFPTWLGLAATFIPTPVAGMGVFYDSTAPNDDWAITPGIFLEAGPTYQLSFYRQGNASFGTSLRVLLGDAPTVVDMNAGTLLFSNANVTNGQYETIPFTVGTTGVYHIGFHDNSAADLFYLFVGDIEVTELPAFGTDLTPDALVRNGRRGTENLFSFTINNTGGGSDDYTVGVTGGTWTTALYEADGTTPLTNPVSIAGGGSSTFVVGVTIPGATADGTTESFSVNATGVNSNDSSSLDVTSYIYNEMFPGTVNDGPLSDFGFTVYNLSGASAWRQTPINTIGANPIPGMRVTFDGTQPNDDWAITPGIFLETGPTYTLAFERRAPASSFPATFAVYVGDGTDVVDQTGGQLLLTRTAVFGNASESANFTVPSTGTYHIGFHDTTPPDEFYTFIGAIQVTEAPAVGVEITADNADRTVQRATSTSYVFTVTNTGAASTDYTATLSGNTWATTLFEADGTTPLASPFNLGSGGTQTIVATVAIPGGAAVSSTDSFTITVEDTGFLVSDAAGNTTTAAEFNWGGPFGGYHFSNHLAGASGAPSFPPTPDWIDITGIGTDVTSTLTDADDGRTVPPLAINHAFDFFGVTKTQAWAQANGFVAFTDPGTGSFFTPTTIPTVAAPNDMAALYWRDLRFNGAGLPAGTSQMWYHSNAFRTVITYLNVARWGSSGLTVADTISMQIVLLPDNRIYMNYQTAGAGFLANASASGTIGLENATGAAGIQYRAAGAGGPYQGNSPLSVVFGDDANDLPVELSGFSLD